MSMTPVPISIRLVRAPTAASSAPVKAITSAQPIAFSTRNQVTKSPSAGSVKKGIAPGGYSIEKSRYGSRPASTASP